MALENKEDIYTFGYCSGCSINNLPLKNYKCIKCQEIIDMPDFFKDLFNKE